MWYSAKDIRLCPGTGTGFCGATEPARVEIWRNNKKACSTPPSKFHQKSRGSTASPKFQPIGTITNSQDRYNALTCGSSIQILVNSKSVSSPSLLPTQSSPIPGSMERSHFGSCMMPPQLPRTSRVLPRSQSSASSRDLADLAMAGRIPAASTSITVLIYQSR